MVCKAMRIQHHSTISRRFSDALKIFYKPKWNVGIVFRGDHFYAMVCICIIMYSTPSSTLTIQENSQEKVWKVHFWWILYTFQEMTKAFLLFNHLRLLLLHFPVKFQYSVSCIQAFYLSDFTPSSTLWFASSSSNRSAV